MFIFYNILDAQYVAWIHMHSIYMEEYSKIQESELITEVSYIDKSNNRIDQNDLSNH